MVCRHLSLFHHFLNSTPVHLQILEHGIYENLPANHAVLDSFPLRYL